MRIADTLAGTGGIVDLWYWIYGEVSEAKLLDFCDQLLSASERQRYARYRFERDRRLFLATRALVRTVLSRYVPIAPADWCFEADVRGKPRIVRPAVAPPLYFNLANTPGLVACVVSTAHIEVGVDAERLHRQADFQALAHRFFSVTEARALGLAGEKAVPRRFFDYWTLKESFVKACGAGLSVPLDQFSFRFDAEDVTVQFERMDGVGSDWRFALVDAPPDHLMAVAAHTGGASLQLRTAHITPVGP